MVKTREFPVGGRGSYPILSYSVICHSNTFFTGTLFGFLPILLASPSRTTTTTTAKHIPSSSSLKFSTLLPNIPHTHPRFRIAVVARLESFPFYTSRNVTDSTMTALFLLLPISPPPPSCDTIRPTIQASTTEVTSSSSSSLLSPD
jgi:hypothetical protein